MKQTRSVQVHVRLVLSILTLLQANCFIVEQPGTRVVTELRQTKAISVLYESEQILAILKPEGVSHHDDGEVGSGIMSLVRKQQANGQIVYQGRLYGVHRLDRVTSGILLFAKDSETAGVISTKFREGEISKYYCGISARKPKKKKQGWIKGNMVKGRRKSWLLTREGTCTDNYATTRFFSSGLSTLADHLMGEEEQPKTLLLFRPYSGRTHQLRVAAKSVGLPLLGDPTYKDGNDCSDARRTYLHACALHFTLDDDDVTIWSSPPFGGLWDSDGQEGFEQLYRQLVRKHCDCESIKLLV